MPFRITQLPAIDKLCQQIEVVPVEQVYPRELVSDLLTETQGWERRERKLTHLLRLCCKEEADLLKWREKSKREVSELRTRQKAHAKWGNHCQMSKEWGK